MSGLVSAAVLGRRYAVRPETILGWARRGIIPSVPYGKQVRFDGPAVDRAVRAWRASQGTRDSKECTVCGEVLPIERFQVVTYRAKREGWSDWTGPSADCRACRAEKKRAARARKAEQEGRPYLTREQLAEEARARALREQAEKELRAAEREAEKAAHAARRRVQLEKQGRKGMTLTREETRARVRRQRERYNSDPEYQAAIKAKKIRRKRAQESTRVVPVNRELVAERDGWRCAICGKRVTRKTWSLDHIVPLARGGSHTYENVTLAHLRCNIARGVGRRPVQAPLFATPGVAHPHTFGS